MLNTLSVTNLGPADTLSLTFSSRLNVLTGDNGLGKSFILDVAWWVLTRQWAGLPAWPREGSTAQIDATLSGKSTDSEFKGTFEPDGTRWKASSGRPIDPGMVLFAQADGGFAVYDATRRENQHVRFAPHQIWEGVRTEATVEQEAATRRKSSVICRGLLEDWVTWQTRNSPQFERLRSFLAALSPPQTPLVPGDPVKPPFLDELEVPTVIMPYGQAIPAHYLSAGVRRVMAIAYLIVWAWTRHVDDQQARDKAPTSRIVLMVDELEAHLHPKWQRTILPALLGVMSQLGDMPFVQVIAATHSPLVLASLEPHFDASQDRLSVFDLVDGAVRIFSPVFEPQGDVSNWLVSDLFELGEASSLEAEEAMIDAMNVLNLKQPALTDIARVDEKLRNARLVPGSAFGARWAWFKRQNAPFAE